MRRIGHLYPGLSQASPAAPRALTLQERDPRTLVGLEYLHTHNKSDQQQSGRLLERLVGGSVFHVQDESKMIYLLSVQ